MPLRIVVADDNGNLRERVRVLLNSRPGWRVVGEAANGRDAVEKAEQILPDVMVVDYSMPELDGISAIQEIHRVSPQTEVVVLTIHDAQFTVGRAVNVGARGYVVKSQIMRDLMPAVEAASQHRTFLSFLDAGQEANANQASPVKKSSV